MKILIAGASGMIGGLILQYSLSDPKVSEVVSIVRKPLGISDPKLNEVIWKDFSNLDGLESVFRNVDYAHFCIGVYTGAVSDDLFKKITVDYAVVFGEKLKLESPNATMTFLSGAGADQKEKSRTAFARYKGMAENALIKMNLGALFIFRPGYIYPVTKRNEPNFFYKLYRTLYPLIKLTGRKWSIKSTELANAMCHVSNKTPHKEVLENHDILEFLM